jgi:hypothetical protein
MILNSLVDTLPRLPITMNGMNGYTRHVLGKYLVDEIVKEILYIEQKHMIVHIGITIQNIGHIPTITIGRNTSTINHISMPQ